MQSYEQVRDHMKRGINNSGISKEYVHNWQVLLPQMSKLMYQLVQDTQLQLEKFRVTEDANMSFALTLTKDREPGKVPLNQLVNHVRMVLGAAGYKVEPKGRTEGIAFICTFEQ